MTKIQIDDSKSPKKAVIKKKTATHPKARKINVAKISSVKTTPKETTAKKSVTKKITVQKVDKTQSTQSAPKAAKPIIKKSTHRIAINAVSSSSTHSNLQKSTTLSRRYVHRPTSLTQKAAEEAAKKAAEAEAARKAAEKEAAKMAAEAEAARKAAEEAARIEAARKAEEKEAAKRAAEAEAARRAAEAEARAEVARKAAEAEAAKRAAEAEAARKATETETTKLKNTPRVSALQRRAEMKAAKKAAKLAKSRKNSDRALKSAARAAAVVNTPKDNSLTKNATLEHTFKKKHHGRRILLAIICSAATVGALIAFVHFNMPDISVRVAAMQTGIEATYPTFIPRNYTLANVTTDKDGVVVINFEGPDDAKFVLTEESSTWDSAALLNNYVKKNYPSDYATLREQGITIYTRGQSASWVNGGILYKIEASGKNLTKEQIRNIATSL